MKRKGLRKDKWNGISTRPRVFAEIKNQKGLKTEPGLVVGVVYQIATPEFKKVRVPEQSVDDIETSVAHFP